MKSKLIKKIKPYLLNRYDEDLTNKIINKASVNFNKLVQENLNESKEVKKHTVNSIYPIISIYKAMVDEGIDNKEAALFLDKTNCHLAEGKAKAMQLLCKLPGMYKKMPSIFKSVTKSTFGEKQGFKYKFYETEKTRCKFDMTKCLYCDICNRYNVPELIVCFCHTDDVTDGNIHPKLKWNRSKIMGDGGDCCDFDLYVIDEENK